MELEQFFLVILRTPDTPHGLSDPERAEVHQAHLAYLMGLREKGVLALNGPLRDQPDPTMRGLSFYRTATADEARACAEADPAVRAGVFTFDLMTFLSRPGEVVRSGQAITLD